MFYSRQIKEEADGIFLLNGDMTEISIIMPLYNAEKYLSECLDSVMNQTFKEFEVICVDDASTDDTLAIVQQYAAKDIRIRILQNLERSGAAIARNRGMEKAEGKYIIFLDGDDLYNKEMLEKAYCSMEKYSTDMVMFSMKKFSDEQIYGDKVMGYGDKYRERFCKIPFSLVNYFPSTILLWSGGPWNKLLRKEFVFTKNLQFQDIECNNDEYFSTMAMVLAKKMIVLDDEKVMVRHRVHHAASRISNHRDPMCAYYAAEKILRELSERNMMMVYGGHAWYKCYYGLLLNELKADRDVIEKKNYYNFLKKEGIEHLKAISAEWYDNADTSFKQKIENFIEKDFESGWFNMESSFEVFLEESARELEDLFKAYEKQNMHVGIWGAGKNCNCLLAFCEKHKLHVDAVIDAAKQKQGKSISGHIIRSIEEVCDILDVIMISTSGIYKEVQEKVQGRSIEVIELHQFLGMK